MKKLFFLLTSITLLSCEQAQNKSAANKVGDNRPKKEVEFLKVINNADSVYNEQTNEITKQEALDSGTIKVADFVVNNLNGKIESWPAVVQSIQVLGGIESTFKIQKTEDISEFSSLMLYSNISSDDVKIKDQLKPLTIGDSVLITGVFEKNTAGKIDFETYGTMGMDRVFVNPQFNITIISIKKK